MVTGYVPFSNPFGEIGVATIQQGLEIRPIFAIAECGTLDIDELRNSVALSCHREI